MEKRDIVAAAKVTKVTWTEGQGGSRLSLGGKAVLGEGCRASCDFAGRLFFGLKNLGLKKEESGRPYFKGTPALLVSSLT